MGRARASGLVLLVALSAVAPAGCGRAASSGGPDAVVSTDEQNLLGRWTDADGRALPDGTNAASGILVVATSAGSTTCSADGTVFLQLAWPVGTEVDLFTADLGQDRAPQFIRDTSGSAMDTAGLSDLDVRLPAAARPTGFRRAGNTISVDARTSQVYVTRPDGHTERWARLRGGGCA